MITLHRTHTSGDLVPHRFVQVLGTLAMIPGTLPSPRATMHGQELRCGVGLSLTDDACAAFLLDFPAQGARASGDARGPAGALLAWGLHAVGLALKCRLVDVNDEDEEEDERPADPEIYREAAMAYLAVYEADVSATRKAHDQSVERFLTWLERDEQIELVSPTVLPEGLSLADGPALYEALLESDAVADVFVSERELASFLGRFRARESAK